VSSKLASGNDFLMEYHNGRNSFVSCVSDTALSTASMRARILNEITEYGYYVIYLWIRHFKTAKNLLNKILRPRQDVQSILYSTEK
jgi:hypothetical protein